jgi:hypothetical protein
LHIIAASRRSSDAVHAGVVVVVFVVVVVVVVIVAALPAVIPLWRSTTAERTEGEPCALRFAGTAAAAAFFGFFTPPRTVKLPPRSALGPAAVASQLFLTETDAT